ncbi:MAG: hypothetical protein M1297_02545 [Nitrospirae bacterium]|nr:hypothetical protein [Nitrospirota bacterium]
MLSIAPRVVKTNLLLPKRPIFRLPESPDKDLPHTFSVCRTHGRLSHPEIEAI